MDERIEILRGAHPQVRNGLLDHVQQRRDLGGRSDIDELLCVIAPMAARRFSSNKKALPVFADDTTAVRIIDAAGPEDAGLFAERLLTTKTFDAPDKVAALVANAALRNLANADKITFQWRAADVFQSLFAYANSEAFDDVVACAAKLPGRDDPVAWVEKDQVSGHLGAWLNRVAVGDRIVEILGSARNMDLVNRWTTSGFEPNLPTPELFARVIDTFSGTARGFDAGASQHLWGSNVEVATKVLSNDTPARLARLIHAEQRPERAQRIAAHLGWCPVPERVDIIDDALDNVLDVALNGGDVDSVASWLTLVWDTALRHVALDSNVAFRAADASHNLYQWFRDVFEHNPSDLSIFDGGTDDVLARFEGVDWEWTQIESASNIAVPIRLHAFSQLRNSHEATSPSGSLLTRVAECDGARVDDILEVSRAAPEAAVTLLCRRSDLCVGEFADELRACIRRSRNTSKLGDVLTRAARLRETGHTLDSWLVSWIYTVDGVFNHIGRPGVANLVAELCAERLDDDPNRWQLLCELADGSTDSLDTLCALASAV